MLILFPPPALYFCSTCQVMNIVATQLSVGVQDCPTIVSLPRFFPLSLRAVCLCDAAVYDVFSGTQLFMMCSVIQTL